MHRLQLINWDGWAAKPHHLHCHIPHSVLQMRLQSTQGESTWREAAYPLLLSFPAEPDCPFHFIARFATCQNIHSPQPWDRHACDPAHTPAHRWRLRANPGVLLDILPSGRTTTSVTTGWASFPWVYVRIPAACPEVCLLRDGQDRSLDIHHIYPGWKLGNHL